MLPNRIEKYDLVKLQRGDFITAKAELTKALDTLFLHYAAKMTPGLGRTMGLLFSAGGKKTAAETENLDIKRLAFLLVAVQGKDKAMASLDEKSESSITAAIILEPALKQKVKDYIASNYQNMKGIEDAQTQSDLGNAVAFLKTQYNNYDSELRALRRKTITQSFNHSGQLQKLLDTLNNRRFADDSPADAPQVQSGANESHVVSTMQVTPVASLSQSSQAVSLDDIAQFGDARLFAELNSEAAEKLSYSYGKYIVPFLNEVKTKDIYEMVAKMDALVGRENWSKIPKKGGAYKPENLVGFISDSKLATMNPEQRDAVCKLLNESTLPASVRKKPQEDLSTPGKTLGDIIVLDCPIKKTKSSKQRTEFTSTIGEGARGIVSIGVQIPNTPKSNIDFREEDHIVASKTAKPGSGGVDADIAYSAVTNTMLFLGTRQKRETDEERTMFVAFKSTPGISYYNNGFKQFEQSTDTVLRMNFSFLDEIIRLKSLQDPIIHEDMRLANMLFQKDGSVKLIDADSVMIFDPSYGIDYECALHGADTDSLWAGLSTDFLDDESPEALKEHAELIAKIGIGMRFVMGQLVLFDYNKNFYQSLDRAVRQIENFINKEQHETEYSKKVLSVYQGLLGPLSDLRDKLSATKPANFPRAELAKYLMGHLISSLNPDVYKGYVEKFKSDPLTEMRDVVFKQHQAMRPR